MKQEALKLALEYIEAVPDDRYNAEHIDRDALITAIKEALAQPHETTLKEFNQWIYDDPNYHVWAKKRKALAPEQEVVAWMDADGNVSDNNDHKCFPIPLYTHAPQRTWVGLFDEEIEVLFQTAAGADEEVHIRFARAIESKIKELNT